MQYRQVIYLSICVLSVGCLSGCTSEDSSTAAPPQPVANRCRCLGNWSHIALLRVENTPVQVQGNTLRRDGLDNYRGWAFDATVEALLPGMPRPSPEVPPPPPVVMSRIRVHQYAFYSNGSLIQPWEADAPQTKPLRSGQRVLVRFGQQTDTEGTWTVGIVGSDPETGALTRQWYQFAVGTSAAQVLDPTEWGDYCRGCAGLCGGYLHASDFCDGGGPVYPSDASDGGVVGH